MPRAIVLGNRRLHIALDERYELRDLYWPHYGWENHGGRRRSRLGLRVGDAFSWVSDEDWRRDLSYEHATLVARGRLENPEMDVELLVEEAVHPAEDVWVRRFEVRPPRAASVEDVGLFAHLDLRLCGANYGDTALYDPESGGILHYKSGVTLLHAGHNTHAHSCSKTGPKPENHGSWRDAEDGGLEGQAVAYGVCDSVLELRPQESRDQRLVFWWWLAAAASRQEARRLHAWVARDPATVLREARAQDGRLGPGALKGISPRVEQVFALSHRLLRAHMDESGGLVASADADVQDFNGDTYQQVWPRDAAFAAHALGAVGDHDAAKRCLRFLADRVEPEGFVYQKYETSGRLGETWLPLVANGEPALGIQQDETAAVAWALAEHARRTRDLQFARETFSALRRACDWMVGFRDESGLPRPSWDMWERCRGVFTGTVGLAVAALRGASEVAKDLGEDERASDWAASASETSQALHQLIDPERGTFVRARLDAGHLDQRVDASLLLLARLGVVDASDQLMRRTMERTWQELQVGGPVGGFARYPGDTYHPLPKGDAPSRYPGNAWVITTLWHADWLSLTNRRDDAARWIEWVAERADPAGLLPEQIHPRTGQALNVSPLAWSHATFLESCLLAYRPLKSQR